MCVCVHTHIYVYVYLCIYTYTGECIWKYFLKTSYKCILKITDCLKEKSHNWSKKNIIQIHLPSHERET